jgi:hypothetical protein
MKLALKLASLIALVVIGTGPAIARPDLTAADVVSHQDYAADCDKKNIGKITKVDVITGKEIAKLTKGGMKVDPSKKFAVIYMQRGKVKDYFIEDWALAADVTGADLTSKLAGKPACLVIM